MPLSGSSRIEPIWGWLETSPSCPGSASGSGSAGHVTSIPDASDAVRLIPEVSPKGILRAPSGDPDAATSSMLMASSSMWLGNSSVVPGAMTPTHPSITVRPEG